MSTLLRTPFYDMHVAADVYRELYELGKKDPEYMHNAPHNAYIGRPDDVRATRTPVVRWAKA